MRMVTDPLDFLGLETNIRIDPHQFVIAGGQSVEGHLTAGEIDGDPAAYPPDRIATLFESP